MSSVVLSEWLKNISLKINIKLINNQIIIMLKIKQRKGRYWFIIFTNNTHLKNKFNGHQLTIFIDTQCQIICMCMGNLSSNHFYLQQFPFSQRCRLFNKKYITIMETRKTLLQPKMFSPNQIGAHALNTSLTAQFGNSPDHLSDTKQSNKRNCCV